MSDAEQVLDQFAEAQGWSESTKLDLALRYIDTQDAPDDFRDFLADIADAENDWERPGVNEVLAAAQKATDAANGDSNDAEIEALQNALEVALQALGLEMPEPTDG